MTLGQAYMFQHRQSSEQSFWQCMTGLKFKAQRQGTQYYRKKIQKKAHPSTYKVLTPNDFKAMSIFS